MSLQSLTDEQLEQEIARRKKQKSIPKLIENPDFSNVILMAQDINKSIVDGIYHEDSDSKHYLYEAVMTALYGEKYWKWINESN